MTPYRVNLDIFAGPLDLLLYLVRKDEIDIYDIPIASVTQQYIKHIEMLKLFDIDLAGDFLVMAATLMEIKSVMLLPRVDDDAPELAEQIDPRSELVRQLLEYKKFKDAANLLRDSADQRKEKFTRPDSIIQGIKKSSEPELDLDQISIWNLLEAFDEIMQATGRLQSFDHITDDTPIDLYQIDMLHRLQTEGPINFRDIFQDPDNRLVMIGMFLAMLELIRSRLVWVEQTDPSAPIYLKSLTDEPAEIAVQNAIIANIETQQVAPQHSLESTQNADFTGSDETQPTDQPKKQKAPIPIQVLLPQKQPVTRDHDQSLPTDPRKK